MSNFITQRFSPARVGAIVFKELKQLARDKITFAMVVMIPLVQLILFGYAINTDVRHVPAGLVDFSQTSYSRNLVQQISHSQVVDFVAQYHSVEQAQRAITAGDVSAVLILPSDLLRRVAQRNAGNSVQHPATANSDDAVAQWLTDGSDPMISGAISGLSRLPVQLRTVPRATLPSQDFALLNLFNPERRTAVNIVPGLIAVILTMTMILFTSAALVREREQGNMEFLITTPIRPLELMVGKILPYIVVGYLQMLIILGLGYGLFAVPLPQNWGSLLLVTLCFIVASLTMGLLISTRAQTQLQAMQMTVFILLPSILLSGFMFPFAAMPKPAQYLAEVLPATHYVRMIRAVVLRDAHWWQLQFDIGCLLAFSVVGFVIATLKFNKRLD